ncbi:MAG TPA: hypothetical protein VFU28_14740 [Vicinamibacterales bacterium]|nr:hypothetical protein [Vicinamibacterales bacterium]
MTSALWRLGTWDLRLIVRSPTPAANVAAITAGAAYAHPAPGQPKQ